MRKDQLSHLAREETNTASCTNARNRNIFDLEINNGYVIKLVCFSRQSAVYNHVSRVTLAVASNWMDTNVANRVLS